MKTTVRTHRFALRVTTRDLRVWRSAAKRAGSISVSDFVRMSATAAALVTAARAARATDAESADARQLELPRTRRKS